MAYHHSTHTTTRALIYNYIHIQPQLPRSEYILFLHGFPSTSLDWRHQISFFATKGYGIIAPDLLGFGGHRSRMYRGKGMASDIVEILVAEGIRVVVGVAHDWYVSESRCGFCHIQVVSNGRRVRKSVCLASNDVNAASTRGCFLLSRLANYYPELFSAYAFIDHGYATPGRGLTTVAMQNINSSVQARLGFSIFGYFLFFDEEDAPKLLDEHAKSVESLFFSTDKEINKKYKGALGGFRTWLTEGKTADLPAYLTSEDHEHYRHAFSVEKGGYGPATNWYRASLRNINEEDEQKIPTSAYILTHPTLLIASTNFITATINFPEQMRPHVPDLRVEKVDGGHWLQLEKPDEVNRILDEFLEEKQRV
ncbi:Cytosolic epoxide hydrolase 2 [Hyphodiscus hymeniophilus]|uniref:Cytosolic epoxide hydrolase 2 n=1 Tax=Hyphodiscus hymeniophilus TaxID=353542 RepID=A0A9P7AXZ5_9HELO|nr:Cytosolic epoxide hydrolase 2 [Hyphodiscus hymeniophilus]